MFDFVRNNQKLMMFILLLFITPAFVLFGVDGFTSVNANSKAYAKVGDHLITPEEFDQIKRQRIEEARAQSGPNFDPKLFDSPDINRQLLDSLVTQYLFQKSMEKQYLTASDQALQEEIMNTPLFQKDGKFDKELYVSQLAARGLTPLAHQANMRFNLARNQVLDPLLRANFFPASLVKSLDDVQLSGRVVQVKTLDLGPYLAKVSLSNEQIESFYKENQARFTNPQKADVEFVTLSAEDIKSRISVSDADVAQYYEQNKARFSSPEERKARHILLPAEKAGNTADELKAQADKVLAEVKASPAKFAELAKKYSVDTGSAPQGGDLGFFGKGAMVPAFDQAVFAMKKGDISGLVKSEFGYHIIELVDTRGGAVKSLDSVKAQIADEIKTQKATAQVADAQGRFSELVYEGGQSFDNVVKALGVKTVAFSGLTQVASGNAPAVLKDAKLLAEIFSDDSIKNRNNTKAVQVGDVLVSARITRYDAATPKPLAEVRGQIEARLKQDEAQKLALADAQATVARLNEAKPAAGAAELAGFGAAKTISALGSEGLLAPVAQAALNTAVSELPKATLVNVGAAGVAVAYVVSGAPSSEIRAKADPKVVGYYESLTSQAYQEALVLASRDALKKRVDVEVRKQF